MMARSCLIQNLLRILCHIGLPDIDITEGVGRIAVEPAVYAHSAYYRSRNHQMVDHISQGIVGKSSSVILEFLPGDPEAVPDTLHITGFDPVILAELGVIIISYKFFLSLNEKPVI